MQGSVNLWSGQHMREILRPMKQPLTCATVKIFLIGITTILDTVCRKVDAHAHANCLCRHYILCLNRIKSFIEAKVLSGIIKQFSDFSGHYVYTKIISIYQQQSNQATKFASYLPILYTFSLGFSNTHIRLSCMSLLLPHVIVLCFDRYG